jgi:hypothetical protein
MVRHSKSAILILEEAVHFLRLAPAALFLSYYVGSLPFILGLLYFWTDMSRSGFAADHLAVGSLGIAVLFGWMKFWHVIFGRQIRSVLSGVAQQPWSVARLFSMAASQILIHATGLFILPLAAVLLAPFGWCYAFYQNTTVQGNDDTHDFRAICERAWQQAKLWPIQNHILLLILGIFGLVVLINAASVIFILPHLLKKFTGVETIFTLSGFHAVNTTFVASALAVSYLCMDPLIKTAYALRCFYGEALKTGADLKTELISFKVKTAFLVAIISMVLIAPLQTQGSQQFDISPAELPSISSEKLDRSIDEVMERREFAWRMPREKPQVEESEESGPLISVLRWVLDNLKKIGKTISGWIQELADWFDNLWPEPTHEEQPDDFDWRPFTRFLLILLLIVLAIVVLYFVVKFWRNRQSAEDEIESETVVKTPDLRDEGIKADELPVNRWLDLARELMAKGSLRLAMRALYLATLAYLSEKELIIIELYKSNRDYEHELYRRAHEKKDLLTAFSKTVMIFDRVWYGMYNITQGDVDGYITDQERIMALVEE